MEDQPTSSPVIKKPQQGQVLLSFSEIVSPLLEGKKITKLEWNNDNIYGCLVNSELMLHKDDNIFYKWILNDGDLKGTDFVVLIDGN